MQEHIKNHGQAFGLVRATQIIAILVPATRRCVLRRSPADTERSAWQSLFYGEIASPSVRNDMVNLVGFLIIVT
ncbi:MAG: hypothetical protein SVY53_04935 [Chloroflexota bacterium]|nr:hypothetical protein [Chloroflexota bacterium]